MEVLMKFLPNKFKSLREFNGLTMKALAEKLGLKYQSIQAWESGKTNPRHIYLHNAAKIFQCNIEEFVEFDPGEYIPKPISKAELMARVYASGHGDEVKNIKRVDCFRRSLQNAVMNLDIPDEAKVKVYHLIGNHIPKPEEYQ